MKKERLLKMKILGKHTIHLIENIVKDTLAPPEDLTIAEWADKYRVLSRESAAEAGKWETDRTPYMKAIFDCVTDSITKSITIMSSAQVGKTELLLNILGRYMHLDPCPILFVQPTVDDAKSFSKERVEPMLRDTKILKTLVDKVNKRETGTVQEKMFPGGYVRFVGANSPSGLASRPIKITLLDEVDRFPLSAKKEGDPVKLAERRTNNFYDSKKIRVSTPTDDATSKIQLLYLAGSQEEWSLPCPYCGEYQALEFEQLKYQDLVEPEFECKFCGESAAESEWIAKFPKEKENRSFHLNALASPWVSWKEIIAEYLNVKDDDFQYKTFINTVLGKTFTVNLDSAMDYEAIYETREDYGAELHDNVVILTAGVDVQDNRLEVEVVGWGYGYESYGIIYRDFPGDPGKEEVWLKLDAFLRKKFKYKNGKSLMIAATLIDSGGHHTGSVYKYVHKKEKRGIYAIKGQGSWGVNILNGFRKTTKKGTPSINLLSLGVNALKDLTYSRLSILNGPGKCHFPKSSTQGYGIDYFKGLTAEVKVKKSTPRGMKIAWEILQGRRNEPLDLRNYATGAVELIPIDLNDKKYMRKEIK